MKIITGLTLGLLLISSFPAKSEEFSFGVSGGLSFADVGDYAGDVAQTIANATGSTTTYSYDRGTWAGRLFGSYSHGESLSLEVGYFITGDIDIEYSITGASATEAFSGHGLDAALRYKFPDSKFFIKGGAHKSTLSYASSITIGGTRVNLGTIDTDGTGALGGIGIETSQENGSSTIFGYDFYASVGGIDNSDFGYLYYGVIF